MQICSGVNEGNTSYIPPPSATVPLPLGKRGCMRRKKKGKAAVPGGAGISRKGIVRIYIIARKVIKVK